MAPFDPAIPEVLPPHNMYNLQIGDKLFVVSGASLSSDAPSYFTNYFLNADNKDKILFIDRSPEVFHYINLHLQGYHIDIPDGDIFTKLFLDAIYYNLPRLRKLLLNIDYHFVKVSERYFKIYKKTVEQDGNKPNLFTIAGESLYQDIAKTMADRDWIRPPPQAPVTIHRSAKLFEELIYLLQGNELHIENDEHRRSLIREAKYYRFTKLLNQLLNVRYIDFLGETLAMLDARDLAYDYRKFGLNTKNELCFKRDPNTEFKLLLKFSSAVLFQTQSTCICVYRPIASTLLALFDHLGVQHLVNADQDGNLTFQVGATPTELHSCCTNEFPASPTEPVTFVSSVWTVGIGCNTEITFTPVRLHPVPFSKTLLSLTE